MTMPTPSGSTELRAGEKTSIGAGRGYLFLPFFCNPIVVFEMNLEFLVLIKRKGEYFDSQCSLLFDFFI